MAVDEVGLGLNSLEKLDNGKIGELVRQHLRRAANDCIDRPADDKPRKVLVEFYVAPIKIVEDDGSVTAELCSVQIKAKSTVPTHQSRPYEMRITANGSGLAYNPGSPTRFPQKTLDAAFVEADGV